MRQFAAILALAMAIVFFGVAISGYFENRKERSDMLSRATRDLTIEMEMANADLAMSTAQLEQENARLERHPISDVNFRKAEEEYELAKIKLGGRSSDHELAQVRGLDEATMKYLVETAAGVGFLIVSLLLFVKLQVKNASPATA